MKAFFSRGALVLLAWGLVLFAAKPSCLSGQERQEPEIPASRGELQQREASRAVLLPQSESVPATDYVIGPEDVLEVDVFNASDLNKIVRVANDGGITLPLVGRIAAAGLTTEQLRKQLESKYGKIYLENPQVTVFVREYHAQPVSVIGAVERPGLYQLTGPRTLIEMLSMAGGLAKRSSAPAGRVVFVTRKSGFGDLPSVEGMRLVASDKVEVNLRRLLYSHEDALNIAIKPIDIVIVSQADIVYVVGEVRRPGGFVLEDREKITVLQALALAEGITGTASKSSARIIRRSEDGSRTEIPLDVGKILKGKAQDLELAANDVLFVPTSSGKAAAKRGAEAAIGTLSGILVYRR